MAEENEIKQFDDEGFGIDTEAEREYLNYKPNFSRRQKMRGGNAVAIPSVEVPITSDIIGVGDGLLTSVVKSWVETKEWIENLHEELKQKLSDVRVPLGVYEEKGMVAGQALGLDLTGGMRVGDYEVALRNLATAEGFLLARLWEKVAEDVDGTLAMELIGDTTALLMEIPMVDDYIQESLLHKVGFDAPLKEDNLELLSEKEEAHGRLVKNLESAYQDANKNHIEATLFSSLEESLAAKDKKRDMSYYHDQVRHLQYGLEEAVQTVSEKVFLVDRSLYLIRDNVEQRPFEKTDAGRLFGEAETDPARQKSNLTRLQALLKFSVDEQNRVRTQSKHTLENIYTLEKRKRLMDEVVNDVNVFEGVALPVHHLVGFYEERAGKDGDALLNDVMRSVRRSFENRESRQQEWYRVLTAEAETRRKKIEQSIEKDKTRQGYHLLTELKKETGE